MEAGCGLGEIELVSLVTFLKCFLALFLRLLRLRRDLRRVLVVAFFDLREEVLELESELELLDSELELELEELEL